MLAFLLAAAALGPPVAALPAWFDALPIELSAATPRPVDRLLMQREIHAGVGQEVFRSVRRINTLDGAEEAAQLQVDYDPEWQSVKFHRAEIHRGSHQIDALASAEFRTLTREASLEQRILDGSKQAVVVLHDVRPGDVLDVAWSVTGDMPQLAGRFAERIHLARDEPLGRLHVRVLMPAARHLTVSLRNGAPPPAIVERRGMREYLWDVKNPAPVRLEANTPAWFLPYPVAELTDFGSWGEVARWALSLVEADDSLPGSLAQLIAPWRGLPEEQRADAAIRFVREQVRYFGMENGIHAHRAHPPALVLARRFGDCKDKALLLVTLLRALGVPAHVALANPSLRTGLDDRSPGPFAFNHAIVRATIGGQARWLDPTRSSQRGALSVLPRLPYARALVVDASTEALAKLPDPTDSDSVMLVEQTWSARDRNGDATLRVATTWTGWVAEARRATIPSQAPEETARNSLAYYRGDEPAIEALKLPAFRDEPEADRFRMEESFRIPRFWATGEHEFDPEVTRFRVPQDAASRTQPLSLQYPWHAIQRTRIELPNEDWNLPRAVHRFETAGFRAEVVEHLEHEAAGPVYVIATDVRTTADFVPAGEVARYAKALDDLRDTARINLTFHGRPRTTAAEPVASWKGIGFVVAFLAVIGAALVGGTRAAEKIRAWRNRRFYRKTQPRAGESAVTPLRASGLPDVQRAARRRRCACGRSHRGTALHPGESVRSGADTVHSVRLPCPCGEVAIVYFVEV